MAALVAAFFVVPDPSAHARSGCRSHACKARVCSSRACRERVEWRHYRRSPMPWCTWGPESGGSYTARNQASTAGGKYQVLAQTWYGYGGPITWDHRWPAAAARPLIQERIARRVLRGQGLGAWVRC